MAKSVVPHLPSSFDELQSALQENADKLCELERLAEPNPFSASKMTYLKHLHLRVIFPSDHGLDTTTQFLYNAGAMTMGDLHDAQNANRNEPHLHNFAQALEDPGRYPDKNPQTPIASKESDHNGYKTDMGVFFTVWDAMRTTQVHPKQDAREAYARDAHRPQQRSRREDFPNDGVFNVRKYINTTPHHHAVSNNSQDGDFAWEGSPLESPLDIRPKPPVYNAQDNNRNEGPFQDAGHPHREGEADEDDGHQVRERPRTDYEVSSSYAFTSLVNCVKINIFQNDGPTCFQQQQQEKSYKFGPPAPPPAGKKQTRDYIYLGRPDGGGYVWMNSGERGVVYHTEIKPFRRDLDRVNGRNICMQEMATLVAVVSERFRLREGNKDFETGCDENGVYHQLMVSYDRDQIWFIDMSFREPYLHYLSDGKSHTLKGLKEEACARFVLKGPFRQYVAKEMVDATDYLAALQIAAVRENKDESVLLRMRRRLPSQQKQTQTQGTEGVPDPRHKGKFTRSLRRGGEATKRIVNSVRTFFETDNADASGDSSESGGQTPRDKHAHPMEIQDTPSKIQQSRRNLSALFDPPSPADTTRQTRLSLPYRPKKPSSTSLSDTQAAEE
ncbi:hypothetical protein P171DRAFT_449874 [Karstenula rhodostoma CBS 690.94]|uniref:Uncharacterized protein n=1 Tax=Karstenula rhodostoma CBS 690.94 TaxID=1392251 RepID=A0A9P4U5F6_9PLEO|nr:hypothetical protein P171DRAFT_449874 [Karstenula rhodostoma CBS 690.94]